MKVFLKLLLGASVLIWSTLGLTSCSDDVVGVGDTVSDENIVDIGKLAKPTSAKIVVVSATSAKVVFSASNNEDNFAGYYLINSSNIVVDSIGMSSPFSGDTSFTITINKDSSVTYYVAAFDSKGNISEKVAASFVARKPFGPYTVMKIINAAAGEGIGVSADSAFVAAVKEGIKNTGYIDEGDADVMFENTKNNGVTITPVNNAKIVYLTSDDELLTAAEIEEIKALTTGGDLASGAKQISTGKYVFTNGKSVRVTSPEDAPIELKGGENFFVMAQDGSYARVVVQSVEGDNVTAIVYLPAKAEGQPLFKK